MARRSAACLGLLVCLVGVIATMGVPLENEEFDSYFDRLNATVGTTTTVGSTYEMTGSTDGMTSHRNRDIVIGNIAYSILGVFLGSALLFISLFDPTRKPVIEFFDQLFGKKSIRRKRDAGEGLESHVAAAFDTFAAAFDKMDMIARVAKK